MNNRRIRRILLGLVFSGLLPITAQSAEYTFVIQPFQPPAATKKVFQPMADYLSKVTGQTIKLVTATNFLTYWQTMLRGKYDLILDAAHLTSYRAKKMNYIILAKQLDTASMTLATNQDLFVFEPVELIGKKIAVLPAPSRDSLTLIDFFPNPLRQPILVEVNNALEAGRKASKGEVDAAIIPSPMVGGFPDLNVVQQTEPWPHVAMSANPRVPADVQRTIAKALIDAPKSPEGQAMLDAVNLSGFEPTSNEVYAGFDKFLQGVWGY
ncbi:MAG: hypothetical protein BMS9Abin15_0399 [Gammaproteobacteria bacterium]|nr:MAG: hypothetical protein BMS9Abin15_0399 [Gammaproteobacteria bacterium]